LVWPLAIGGGTHAALLPCDNRQAFRAAVGRIWPVLVCYAASRRK